MSLSKRAPYVVPLNRITEKWHAPLFRTALRRYISLLNDPELNAAQLEHSLWDIHFPFHSLPVWKVVKYLNIDPVTGMKSTANSVHAKPARTSMQKHHIDGRFDTALVNEGGIRDDGSEGGRLGSIKSMSIVCSSMKFTNSFHLKAMMWCASRSFSAFQNAFMPISLSPESVTNFLITLRTLNGTPL